MHTAKICCPALTDYSMSGHSADWKLQNCLHILEGVTNPGMTFRSNLVADTEVWREVALVFHPSAHLIHSHAHGPHGLAQVLDSRLPMHRPLATQTLRQIIVSNSELPPLTSSSPPTWSSDSQGLASEAPVLLLRSGTGS